MTFRWKSRFDYQGTHRRPGMKTEKPFVERSPITSRKLASNIALAAAITSSYMADLSTQREGERERERERSATVSSARTLAPLLETIVSGQFMIFSSPPFCSFFSPLSFSICATLRHTSNWSLFLFACVFLPFYLLHCRRPDGDQVSPEKGNHFFSHESHHA